MKSIKFVHCADLHLDAPFREGGRSGYAETRRQDIRKAFVNILERAKAERADLLLISGDLFEHRTVARSTMEWLHMKLSEVQVPVAIIPGNHDPYVLNSWYRTWEWPENVMILSPDTPHRVLEAQKINLYGLGFSSFKEDKPDLTCIPPRMNGYFNILIIHGTLDMDFTQQAYKPVTSVELERLSYDYYAFGHFHGYRDDYDLKTAVNPGSPEPLGFDEQGVHGACLVTLTEEDGRVRMDKERFPTAVRAYQDKVLDITGCKTPGEVKIRLLSLMESLDPERDITRITLKGTTDLTLDAEMLSSFVNDQWLYLKIINDTRKDFDLSSLEKDPSLKGAFVREMKARLENAEQKLLKDPENRELLAERERIGRALFFGLEALQNGKIEWWDE